METAVPICAIVTVHYHNMGLWQYRFRIKSNKALVLEYCHVGVHLSVILSAAYVLLVLSAVQGLEDSGMESANRAEAV